MKELSHSLDVFLFESSWIFMDCCWNSLLILKKRFSVILFGSGNYNFCSCLKSSSVKFTGLLKYARIRERMHSIIIRDSNILSVKSSLARSIFWNFRIEDIKIEFLVKKIRNGSTRKVSSNALINQLFRTTVMNILEGVKEGMPDIFLNAITAFRCVSWLIFIQCLSK